MATAIHSPGSKSHVSLIAFGKHPGWDDHIEDIGMDSDTLVTAKRLLYTEGLAGNIDSASWERLEETKRLPGFRQLFFWRQPQGWLVGRMWNSKDGKGRTKYPMVVAGMMEPAPSGWAMEQVLPQLEGFEQKVTQTNSAEMVRFAAGEAKAKLEAIAPMTPSGTSDEAALLAKLVDHPSMDADGTPQLGLYRVFYEMERELTPFRRGSMLGRSKSSGAESKASHMRLPRPFEKPGDSSRAWVALLDREIDPETPVLCFEPEGQDFVDVIVGEPASSYLFCVKATRAGVGLTTEVPYTLDELFVATAKAKAAGCKSPAGSGTGNRPAAVEVEKIGESKGKPWMKWLLGGGAAVVVLGGGIAMLSGGDKKPAIELAPLTADEPTARADVTPAKPEPVRPEAVVPPVVEAPKNVEKPVAKVPEPKVQEPVVPSPVPVEPARTEVAAPEVAVETLVVGSYAAGDPRANWAVERDLSELRTQLEWMRGERAGLGLPLNDTVLKDMDAAVSLSNRIAKKDFTVANQREISDGMESVAETLKAARAQLAKGTGEVSSLLRRQIGGIDPEVRSPELAAAWDGALAKVPTTEGKTKTLAAVDVLKRNFAALDAAVAKLERPAPPKVISDAGAWRTGVEAQANKAIQEAVGHTVAGDGAAATAALGAFEKWSKDAAGFATLVDDASAALDKGVVPAASPKDSAFAGDFAGVVGAIETRRKTLEEARSSTDAKRLLAMMEAGETSHEAVVAAWRKLGTLPWPAKVSELPRVIELSDGVVDAAAKKLDAASGNGEGQADRATVTRTMWKRGAAKVGSASDVAVAMSTLEPCGLTPDAVQGLPAKARYNVLLYELERVVKAADPKAPVGKARLDGFLTAVGALPAEANSAPNVAALVDELKAAAAAPAAPDYATIGPGAKGWAAAVNGDAVTYTKGGQQIEFRTVTSEGSDAMVATTEVSIEQFSQMLSEPAGNLIRELMPIKSGDPDRPAWGVLAWRWNSGGESLRSSNAVDQNGLGWIVNAPAGYYAEVRTPPAPPTMDLPMHRLSGGAAVAFATAMGCRWPSVGEWAAVAAQDGGPANVFDTEFAVLESSSKTRGEADGVTPRSGSIQAKESPTTPAVADGYVWFAPVGHGNGVFKNAIGNVAEFVTDTRARAEQLAARSADELGSARTYVKCGVIGGSALTAGGGAEQIMVEPGITTFKLGFADVGLRLAFTVGKSGPPPVSSATVAKAIEKAGYLASGE